MTTPNITTDFISYKDYATVDLNSFPMVVRQGATKSLMFVSGQGNIGNASWSFDCHLERDKVFDWINNHRSTPVEIEEV